MIETSKSCHFSVPDSAVWLVDNGSLRAESVLALRAQAARLAAQAGITVEAVSVLHSNKVPPEALGGVAAPVFGAHLRACAGRGLRRLLVLPYFWGPSAALTDYLPQQIARVQQDFFDLQVHIAPPLVDLDDPQDNAPAEIAALLADCIRATAWQTATVRHMALPPSAPAGDGAGERFANDKGGETFTNDRRGCETAGRGKAGEDREEAAVYNVGDGCCAALPPVVLVDHGSPQRAVSAVRDCVGAALREQLGGRVRDFAVCSMEAREGEQYAHTLPLFESVLERAPFCEGDVIAAPLFLGPGRHAGEGGDLSRIVSQVRERHPALRVVFCPLPGGSAGITGILLRRLLAGLAVFG